MTLALRAAVIYRGGLTGGNYFVWQKSLRAFLSKIEGFKKKGRRLIDVETYVVGRQRRWAGVFRSGSWQQNFVHSISFSAFYQQLNDPANQGLAPSVFEIYNSGGQPRIAAIMRSGIVSPNMTFTLSASSSTLKTSNAQHVGEGLRLADMQPYISGGKVQWAAIWLPGSGDSYMVTDLLFEDFRHQTQKKFNDQGMRLMDLETYKVNGKRLWAGFGRKGNWANYFIANYSLASFKNKIEKEFHDNSRRLIRMELYST